jgi:CheY-like chemotaxis protein
MTGDKKPVRILCVDDEPHPLDVYKHVLEPHGYEVVTTLSSIEALRIMLTEPIDLLIQDLARPVMSGFELYATLKADKRLQHIPVVICSGGGWREFLGRYPDEACVLAKPFDVEVLLDAVRKALRSAVDARGEDKKLARILCLDDDPSPPAAFKCVLEPHGYEVVTTTSSMEALRIMQTEAVDLLIQDVYRPDMSGITLYGMMKADERLQNIPVVICSGNGVRKFLDHYPDVAGVLEKPFEVKHLLDVVRKALRSVEGERGDIARSS